MARKKINSSNNELKTNSLFDFNINNKENKNDKNINNSSCNISNNSIICDKKSDKKSKSNRKKHTDTTKIANKPAKGINKSEKSVRKHKERKRENKIRSIKSTNENKQPIEKVKVGRRDKKHNWWNGCDYVWVEGIDHWVSKTAFKNEKDKKPEYTLKNYIQGLDSYWCLRYIPLKKK